MKREVHAVRGGSECPEMTEGGTVGAARIFAGPGDFACFAFSSGFENV
jgi:hypothetical protein